MPIIGNLPFCSHQPERAPHFKRGLEPFLHASTAIEEFPEIQHRPLKEHFLKRVKTEGFMNISSTTRRVGSQIGSAARSASPWIEKLARLGYASKGVVYCLIGVLAFQAAIGTAGRITDTHGAFSTVLSQPYGRVLLGLIAVGLMGFAVWRLIQSFADTESEGSDAKGLFLRAGYAASAIFHLLLAVEAGRLSMRLGDKGGGDALPHWTTRVMSKPVGAILVALAGAGLIGYGLYQLYMAYKTMLGKKLDLSRLSSNTRTFVVRASRLGLGSRGVAFVIIGGFMIQAARSGNPSEARGMAGALRSIESAPYGKWVLAVVALGFVGYGIYQCVNARYLRIASI